MAVIVKYSVVRDGVELEQEFLDKKEAEAYDKMLDAAQALAALIKQGELQIDVEPKTVDDISIFLAKNALSVTTILKPVKQVNPESTPGKKQTPRTEPEQNRQKHPKPQAKSKRQAA